MNGCISVDEGFPSDRVLEKDCGGKVGKIERFRDRGIVVSPGIEIFYYCIDNFRRRIV